MMRLHVRVFFASGMTRRRTHIGAEPGQTVLLPLPKIMGMAMRVTTSQWLRTGEIKMS